MCVRTRDRIEIKISSIQLLGYYIQQENYTHIINNFISLYWT